MIVVFPDHTHLLFFLHSVSLITGFSINRSLKKVFLKVHKIFNSPGPENYHNHRPVRIALKYSIYFSTFYNLFINTVSIHHLIECMMEVNTQFYIHLCKHKIPHSFDHCVCIVFRLYAKLLSTHGPKIVSEYDQEISQSQTADNLGLLCYISE